MRVCLNMIVRNEAAVIERCLRSVRPFIDSWAISDTGSDDGTQRIVREFLHDLPGELIERPWVDFATNRNQALALARQHGDYALMLDADDLFEADPGAVFRHLEAPGYMLEIVNRTSRYWRDALVRLDVDWVWKGVLHEYLESSRLKEVKKIGGLRIRVVGGGTRSQMELTEKFARDAQTLRRALHDEPDNTRYAFYLAQSLRDAGQPAAALEAYRQRVAMGGFPEEVFYSRLMIARLLEQLGVPWEETVRAYLDAHRARPQRAEPLCDLARCFRLHRQFARAADYARMALATPVQQDNLFVEPRARGWLARDELAASLHALGDMAGCIAVCREMLVDPALSDSERDRIQRNLASLPPSRSQ